MKRKTPMKTLMVSIAVILMTCIAMAAGTPPRVFEGQATITDADTVRIDGEKLRFKHVDAPETKQMCQDEDGYDYECGVTATNALKTKIGDSPIRCVVVEKRKTYGRFLVECSLEELALGQWLVVNGYALAYRKYSMRYVEEEDEAKAAKRGIWSGTFTPPWEWRKKH